MINAHLMTAEQFAEQKPELPEGGQWCELHAGEVVSFMPPDEAHGTTILNLSKALANYFETSQTGYACFELGLLVARNPDTVRSPAVSYFAQGKRFAETDKDFTDIPPSLVIEIASTDDRRVGMRSRLEQYFKWGVPTVWVIEPRYKHVNIHQPGKPRTTVAEHQSLEGSPIMTGFSVRVQNLFEEPKWWRG